MIPVCDVKKQYEALKAELDAAILAVARDAQYILGPNVKAFEQEAAKAMGAAYAVGVANGTDALTLALRALDIGPGDEVITTPFTFIATAEAVSLVGATTSDEQRRALGVLLDRYLPALRAHLLHKRRLAADAADDLLQEFVSAKVLEQRLLEQPDRARGKFRTFLLTAFRNFIADDHDRSSALKRGGGEVVLSLDYASVEAEVLETVADTATPEQAYAREWALHVLSRALQAIEQEYEDEGNPEEFAAFRQHLSCGDAPRPSYQDMGRALGVSESVVRNRLHAARKRYARSILQVIRSYTATEEDAQEELRDLFNAFS